MQTARLLMPMPRNIKGKFLQIFRAWQLEQRFSKEEILRFYLTLAPFGGNIEGVSAASFRYFGKSPEQLQLAEAALLVALPQAPERYRPDRFPATALAARNKVLQRAQQRFNEEDLRNAIDTALPSSFKPWPDLAPHLAFRLYQQRDTNLPGIDLLRRQIHTCIHYDWQRLLSEQARSWEQHLSPKKQLGCCVDG